jgi:hypothetical protein
MTLIIDHLLIVTLVTVITGIGLLLLVFLGLTRLYPHEATRAQFGSALAGLLVAVLFSVILNNWYTIKRDRDNRSRALRDQHFAQLRPVLRTESSKFKEIAAQVTEQGHIARINHYETPPMFSRDALWPDLGPEFSRDTLWPDVTSRDLGRHFSGYDERKQNLADEIKGQDEDFRKAVSAAEDHIPSVGNRVAYWKDVVATSYFEQCTGHGDGITIRFSDPDHYVFGAWRAGVGSNGSPSSDQLAAFHAFQWLKSHVALGSQCDSLKRGAEKIIRDAQTLSDDAQKYSESTILKGDCDFLKSDSLSD